MKLTKNDIGKKVRWDELVQRGVIYNTFVMCTGEVMDYHKKGNSAAQVNIDGSWYTESNLMNLEKIN